MAKETYWEFKAPEPPAQPPKHTKMTIEQWEQLSPGYRRAIAKEFEKRKDLFDFCLNRA